jgi:catalase (peroxidase I)
MITFDASTGLGGLDASIGFETDRPENIGVAFNATLQFLNGFYSPRISMADLIAFAVHAVLTTCGGPTLEYRNGRIDALEAGPLGVPQPKETLAVLSGRFAKAAIRRI